MVPVTFRSQHSIFPLLACLIFIVASISFKASAQDRQQTFFDTLYNMDIDRIDVLVDLDSVLINKMTDNEHDGQMKIHLKDGSKLDIRLDIEVRSKSRRRYCDFPPLKFDFKKGDLDSLGLHDHDKYKLVTHCLDAKDGKYFLLKEFMLYELYQIVTPVSLRAKVFDIRYLDVGSSYRLDTKGVILESEEEFAVSQDGKLCECMGTKRDSINALLYEQLAMFQFMIGNNDMDYQVERNIKLVELGAGQPMIPFAYDFDFSSFVNAPYVYPEVNDNRILPRKYMGFKENAALVDQVKDHFIDKKKEILDYIDDFEGLPKSERRNCYRYIREFYRYIENPRFELPYGW